MLSGAPQLIEGVAVFRDDRDPLTFYYLAQAPQLALEQGLPQIQLIRYGGDAARGGLLTLTVALRVEQERLARIAARLGPGEQVSLLPAPLLGGRAQLLVLDHAVGPITPALQGEHQASFTLELPLAQANLLAAALPGDQALPIRVYYVLDYLELRPAYRFRLHADWQAVQRQLTQSFAANLVLLRVEVEHAVAELIERRAITVELLDELAPGEDRRARDAALREAQDLVLNSFFEARPRPVAVADEAAPFGFSLRVRELERIDQRLFDLLLSEERVLRRRIYPQATLQGLADDLVRPGVEISRFLPLIDLDHAFDRRRTLTAVACADFAADGIRQIDVTLDYGNRPQTLRLTAERTRAAASWNAIVVGERETLREVALRYRVVFDSARGERPRQLSSPEAEITLLDQVEIVPRTLYSIRSIPVMAVASFPWDRYESVVVRARYQDEAGELLSEPVFLLRPESREHVWTLFCLDPRRQRFRYQLSYRPQPGQQPHETGWLEGEDQIIVRAPRLARLELLVSASFDWATVERVTVDLRYRDPAGLSEASQSLSFSPEQDTEQRFGVDLLDPGWRIVEYEVTIFQRNGTLRRIPRSATREPILALGAGMTARQIVELSAQAVDFAAMSLRELWVDIAHDDQRSGVATAETLTFASPDDRRYFAFRFTSAADRAYRYRLVYYFANGMTAEGEWQRSQEQRLLLAPQGLERFLQRTVTIAPQGLPWQRLSRLTLRLRYGEGAQRQRTELRFSEAAREERVWQIELAAPQQRRYAWQIAAEMRERLYGRQGLVYLPGPDDQTWQQADDERLDLAAQLPDDEALAARSGLLLLTVVSAELDWTLLTSVKLALRYGGSTRSVRIEADDAQQGQTILLPLRKDDGDPQRYEWQLEFRLRQRGAALVYYPGPGARPWASGTERRIVLARYLPPL